jgi:type IV pilus assembly protein PilB
MFIDHNSTIYEILSVVDGMDLDYLDSMEVYCRENGLSLASELIEAGVLNQGDLLQLIADYLGYEFLEVIPSTISPEMIKLLNSETARNYAVIPYAITDGVVNVLAKDPFNNAIIDDLTFTLNRDVVITICDPSDIDGLLEQYYGEKDPEPSDLLANFTAEFDGMGEGELEDMANETPIIRFVNLVLQQAVKDKASDIHFEPFEDIFRIRYRIDGALYEMAPPPKSLAVPVISRIKVLADLNIAENRIPQDGKIKMTISGTAIDLRVSTLPTQFGESVVLRVLDKSSVNLDLDKLTIPDDVKNGIREAVRKPNGIFIVTGPTGSGKTTTLYAALREVNTIDEKILTAEDPVEYEIEGLMQVPINHEVGLDFSKALRAFLRQDPDKIMVGEIRDLETAQIAVQASLTGHVVLSTLHTNDAAGAVTRLVDMGLEPFLISSSLEVVLAQRLIRRICASCRTPYEPDGELLASLNLDPMEIANNNFYYGKGCPVCSKSGYKGRVGLFEMIKMTDSIRELINEKSPTLVIKDKALQQGMRSLRDDGIRAIFDGTSSIEEVLKYT